MDTTEPAATDAPQIVELIPGEEVLVFLDPADVPDDETVSELRMQAYAHQDDPTLGASEVVQIVETVTEWAGSGIVGAAAVAPVSATLRYLRKLREEPTGQPIDAARATEIAQRFCTAALSLPPGPCRPITATPTKAGFRITLDANGLPVSVSVNANGTIARYRVRER